GKLVNAVAEDGFIFGQPGQCRGGGNCLIHENLNGRKPQRTPGTQSKTFKKTQRTGIAVAEEGVSSVFSVSSVAQVRAAAENSMLSSTLRACA
ncbi:MAG: hypothetical protein Q8L75_09270, partial [Acidobacteriota bacterium]|nr:hypothetical protein [Acidobacteriota bacterium]